MARTAVAVSDLSMMFRLFENRAYHLKEVVSRLRFSSGRKDFWALKDVSFEVEKGTAVGLIGENGSGKSTLLKTIAGILPPTRGQVLVGGSVSSLIELGAGFHAELTGRENIHLNGALFGLTRRQIQKRFESIVGFAEVESFLDQPIRAYSSGMTMRLAFSLAIHVEPQILLIDEVLAVGDEAFQRKCVERVAQIRDSGVTVMFVSHDAKLVEQICSRTILLDHGRILRDGPSHEVVKQYLKLTLDEDS